MISGGAISSRPISSLYPAPLLAAKVLAALGHVRVYTLQVYSGATGALVLCASTAPYTTKPNDFLPNLQFDERLAQGLKYERSIEGSDGFNQVSAGVAEILVHNADGLYDDLISLGGCVVSVKAVWQDASFETAVLLFAGLVRNPHVDTEFVRFQPQDDSILLDVPMSANTYSGAGGINGDTIVNGKRRPLVFGFRFNVPPLLINSANLIYQYNDGPVSSVNEVRDDALSLSGGTNFANYAALAAEVMGADLYATCTALGLLRLKNQPAGEVTCSVFGMLDTFTTGSPYIDDTASIVQYALRRAAPSVVRDAVSISAVSAAQPAEVDYFVAPDDNTTLHEFIDDMMGGIGGFGALKRDKTFHVGIIDVPSGTSVASYQESDIVLRSLVRLELPDGVDPPCWRRRAIVARNDLQQSRFAGAVGPEDVNLYSQPYALAPSDNASLSADILADEPAAQDPPPMETFFSFFPGGEDEATRKLELFAPGERELFEFVLATPEDFLREIGEVVTLTHSRFDLDAGKQGIIVKTGIDTNTNRVTLRILT